MSEKVHTPDCLAAQKAAAEYRARFPKYCKSCQGWGGYIIPGVWRTWNGDGTPDEYTVCPDCEGQDLCPRCGAKRVFHEEGNPAEIRQNKELLARTETRWHYFWYKVWRKLTLRRVMRLRYVPVISDYTSGYHENCPECGYVCSACGMDNASDGCTEVECWCGFAEQLAEEEKFAAEMGKEPQLCPHGKQYHECNTCLEASDRAYDAARERRYLGR